MILEEGTDEQMKECVVDACLPRAGECWRYEEGKPDLYNIVIELCVLHVSRTNIETERNNFRVWRWLELFGTGRLERLE